MPFAFITLLSPVFSFPLLPSPVPCTPQNVSATLGCFNHSALVTWVGSPSAVGYNVTVTGQGGHTHHCHTNTSNCQVPDIHCGETHGITVTAFSQTCTGNLSAVYSFRAGAGRLTLTQPKFKLLYYCPEKITILNLFSYNFLQVFVLPVTSLRLQLVRTALSLGLQ